MFDQVSRSGSHIKDSAGSKRPKVLVLFGTRPELIKLAPVIRELKKRSFPTVVVSSSQHKDLLAPFLAALDVEIDHDLAIMRRNQTLNEVASRVLLRLDNVLDTERPDLVLLQGDTTTTMSGAIASFNRKVPVGHVEAGLRSRNLMSPFPEEMNRRLVSQVASLHFAATETNRRNLIAEGIPSERIFVTGNPIVDCLQTMLKDLRPSVPIRRLIAEAQGQKLLLLTTHRRESFGPQMSANLRVLRSFVEARRDITLVFPVHPNPNVSKVAEEILGNCPRIHLLQPLGYADFLELMKAAWLIVSDSGGVQEEAPSLGKPLLVIRENTERPEAVTAGVAKLVGNSAHTLKRLLEETYTVDSWLRSVKQIANPFGDGHSASRIVRVVEDQFAAATTRPAPARLRL